MLKYEEAKRELGLGQSNDGGGEQSLLDKYLPLIMEMIKQVPAGALANAQARLPTPSPAGQGAPRALPPAYAPQPPPAASTPSEQPYLSEPMSPPSPTDALLAQGLPVLCLAARFDDGQAKVAEYAELLLDKADDAQYLLLSSLVERPDAVDQLGAIYAPVLDHRAWFEQLRLELRALFAQDAADAQAENPTAGRAPGLHGGDSASIKPARGGTDNKAEHAAGHAAAAPGHARKTPAR